VDPCTATTAAAVVCPARAAVAAAWTDESMVVRYRGPRAAQPAGEHGHLAARTVLGDHLGGRGTHELPLEDLLQARHAHRAAWTVGHALTRAAPAKPPCRPDPVTSGARLSNSRSLTGWTARPGTWPSPKLSLV